MVNRADEIFIVGPKIPGIVRDMWHTPVKTIDVALRKAFNILGSSAKILVIPKVKIGGFIVDIKS